MLAGRVKEGDNVTITWSEADGAGFKVEAPAKPAKAAKAKADGDEAAAPAS